MSIELPTAITGYFTAANAHDATAMLRFFIQEAAVIDEKEERRGHAAIDAWEKETYEQYLHWTGRMATPKSHRTKPSTGITSLDNN